MAFMRTLIATFCTNQENRRQFRCRDRLDSKRGTRNAERYSFKVSNLRMACAEHDAPILLNALIGPTSR